MKQRITLISVAIAVVVGLWWALAGPSNEGAPEEPLASDSGLDRKAILAKKQRARAEGEIDRSPARALGRVTDAESGVPIRGAVVLLTPKGLEQLARAMTPGEQATPLRTHTDAEGHWSIDGVGPGRYALSATGRGYLPTTRTRVTLEAGRDNAGLDLKLAPGGHELRGTVSDIGGGPVEDVLLRVTRMDEGSLFNFDRPGLGAVTDEEGSFSIQLPDGHYQLATFHIDYVDASEMVRIDNGPRSIDLRIIPAGSVSGQVLAAGSGEPVAGAIVSRSGERGGGFEVQGMGEGQVTTDSEGRFRLRGLSSGVVRISAVAPGYATRQPVEVVLGVAEEVDEVEVLVYRALTISGFVVARGDEERGLEGVLVGAFSFDPARLYIASAPSAADGYFEIFGVLPGGYTVGAVGEDALPNFLGASAQVHEEDLSDVLVIMDAGARVRGQVVPPVAAKITIEVDPKGISIGTMMQTMSNALVRGRSDDEGRFELHPVADGAFTVVAEADDGSHGRLQIEVDGGTDVAGLVVELQARASVAGQVVDASGKPGAGLNVRFRAKERNQGAGIAINFDGMGLGSNTATTDENGDFNVKGLDAGEYDVSVLVGRGQTLEWALPENPEEPTAPRSMSVSEAEQRRGVSLVVEAREGVITGVVFDPEGQPMADAWVTAIRDDSARDSFADMRRGNGVEDDPEDDDETDDDAEPELRRWEGGFAEPPALTDEVGRFRVDGLRAGSYSLRAEAHKDGARGFIDRVALDSDIRIELQALAGIEGLVRFRGKPVVEYTIDVRGPARRQQQVHATDGRFEIRRLDAGEYEVLVHCSEGNAQAEVEITEGGTTSVDLEIGGWGTLRGVVIDAGTGDPIAGLSITVIGEGGPAARSMMGMFTGVGPTTDDEGRFEIDEVPPGEGKIMFIDRDAVGMGGAVAEAEYAIEPEETYDLGTITGVAPNYLDPDERGTVGLLVKVATYAKRPRAPKAEDDEEQAAFDETDRLWIWHVTPDSGAAQEGLVPGDEILSIDGAAIAGMGAVNAAKLLSPRYLKVGEEVSIEIEHDGSRRSMTLMVVARDREGEDDEG